LKLRETVEIRADVAKVWALVGDPHAWPKFVDKISAVKDIGGTRFEIMHRKGLVTGELLDGKIERDIAMRLDVQGKPAVIRYQIEDLGASCRVTEVEEFSVPFPFNLLILWIHGTGRKVGESNLDKLKRILESGISGADNALRGRAV
jgi:hypothetical protein